MAESDKGMPPAAPPEGSEEPFLSRWSRRKEEARQAPPETVPAKSAESAAPAPELPPVDKLTFESDYRAFFHPKVDEDVRRAALKKLFTDPRFNVMDGLDVYIDDYSKTEPIPPEMLAGLRQAQNILGWAKEDAEARAREEARLAGAAPAALEPPGASSVPAATAPAPSEMDLEEGTPDAVPAASENASKRSDS